MTAAFPLATALALVIGLVAVVSEWDPNATGQGAARSLVQWVACWGLLAVLGVGVGRRLRAPVLRWFVIVPLCLVLLAHQWNAVLSDARIMWVVPAGPVVAGLMLLPTMLAWWIGLLAGPRVRRWLEDQQ